MASTAPAIDAIDYATRYIKNVPLQPVATKIINEVAAIIWSAAPWSWTLGSLPTITLLANTQDYTINYPADFQKALEAVLINGDGNERELHVLPALPTNVGFVGQPNYVSYPAAAGTIAGLVRVSPKPAQVQGTQTVIGLYKKLFTPFTDSNIYTTGVPEGDNWYHVFQSGVLWKAYPYADDQRAGDASVRANDAQVSFSGARGTFEANLIQMKEREPLLLINVFERDQKDPKK